MQYASRVLTLVASLTLATLSAMAVAQSAVIYKSTCQDVGMGAREPLGDRDGHAIAVGQYSCRNEGGIEDGSIMTGGIVWEWDKNAGIMLSGNGVIRKPGALAVYQNSDGKIALTTTDGKVTGVTGTAKGVYKTASGSMAPLAGKSFNATFHSTGPGQFVIEVTVE
jgi:hypothetical protein